MHILLLLFISAAYAGIDCTLPMNAKKYRTLCSAVIDPIKFKRGEKYVLNCGKELGDGYEAGICKNVDAKFQRSQRKK